MTDPTLNVEEVYDELRRALLEKLREETAHPPRAVQQSFHIQNINQLLPERQILEHDRPRVEALLCQIVHELYLERVIVPGTGDLNSSHTIVWPFYHISDHGRRVLQTGEYSPYDPDGYLRRLKSEIPDVDDTIVRYVEESLKCLRMDCLLAATVTIGCASEQATLLLIERFGQAITDPRKKQAYEKDTSNWIISKKYKAFRQRLDGIKNLPKELSGPLEQQLHGVFDLIRQKRNEAGHPTGEPVTRETVVASHLLFPGYCKYVYALMDHFAKNPASI